MRSYLSDAIRKLKPGSEFSFTDDDYSTIKWDVLEGSAPTKLEIDAAIIAIKKNELLDAETKAAAKAALLKRLGITEDEAKLLLG
jgi:hypothetical protein